jgi:adenosylcobinamide amidohydrolase
MALTSPRVTLKGPWLEMDLGHRHQVAGWPIVGPSWGKAATIAWLQVKDADLPATVSPEAYFRARARADRIEAEIGLMTAADISLHACERASNAAMEVTSLVTAGLSNGESVQPHANPPASQPAEHWHAGTVNIVTHIAVPLTQAAMFEAISIVAQARTAAIIDLGISLIDGRKLTGTGTDCIIVAAPAGSHALNHCGLHTALGRLIGETTYSAARRAMVSRS